MKLVRQLALEQTEGPTTRVYEVDLCELGPERFVVNFRFGRKGGVLQDGSRTPLPVPRAQAERVFDALVAEKTSKGWLPPGALRPAAPAPPPSQTPAAPAAVLGGDPRAERILAVLAGRARPWGHSPDAAVWRAGELHLRAAAPLLASRLPTAPPRAAWHLCRALLRCGDEGSLGVLYAQWEHAQAPGHVRSMAAHAIATLSTGAAAETFRRRVVAGLPGGALDALVAGDVPLLSDLSTDNPTLVDRLYSVADVEHRAGLLAVLEDLPLAFPTFVGLRRVFQAAEARGDGEVWGLLARRFESERATRRVARDLSAWTGGTRNFFRRRAWRTLLRLGTAGLAEEYVSLASGLLEAARSQSDVTGWASVHVVYGADGTSDAKRFRFRRHHRKARAEVFPALWDAFPLAYARLLSRSWVPELHEFAVRGLRANPRVWPEVPLADVVAWLWSKFPATVALGAELAIGRYDPRNPDVQLVLALLACAHAPAREAAQGWVRSAASTYLAVPELVVALVLHDEPTVRRFALELLGSATLAPDRARALVDAVIQAALATLPDDDGAAARIRDATLVLVTAFPTELRTTPLDLVARLVGHPAAGAAELGARILLVHAVRAPELPDDLLAAAMTSPHPAVRGIGVRLYGELPDSVLAERLRVLLALVTSALPDVRAAARPIVDRLAGHDDGFAKAFVRALLPALAGPLGPVADDLVGLLRAELGRGATTLPARAVLGLLRAHETVVQELGGEWLLHVDPAALGLRDLAVVVGSDVAAVRRLGWRLVSTRADAFVADPDALLPLLDAPWADSREQARAFVRDQVGAHRLPAPVLVAICDSVRPDVQGFGRSLLTASFDSSDGPEFLSKLAQHPDPAVQTWASAWLEQHAAGQLDRLAALVPFFAAVLARPNRAKAAKARVLAFLAAEASRAVATGDEATARVVAGVLSTVALSAALTHRAQAIAALVELHARFPDVPTGVVVVPEPGHEGRAGLVGEVPGAV